MYSNLNENCIQKILTMHLNQRLNVKRMRIFLRRQLGLALNCVDFYLVMHLYFCGLCIKLIYAEIMK